MRGDLNAGNFSYFFGLPAIEERAFKSSSSLSMFSWIILSTINMSFGSKFFYYSSLFFLFSAAY